MSFAKAGQIQSVIQNMVQADIFRGQNRADINRLFNGAPPYTPREQVENRIDFNVNDLSGTRIIHQARQTWVNAFQKPNRYFDVNLDIGPTFKRQQWGETISKYINRTMKRSMSYTHYLENKFAATVLHGIGPGVWSREGSWCPMPKGPEDILVPLNTLTSLENLSYFAINMTMNAQELARLKRGNSVKGWNQPFLQSILEKLGEQVNFQMGDVPFNQWQFPEKVETYFKENSAWLGTDAVPTIRCWDFYFKDVESGNWNRRIVVDPNTVAIQGMTSFDEFLFDPGDMNYGTSVSKIMHVMFADGCVVAPFRWHSVRSLGYLLYTVCHAQNRIHSKFLSAVLESMQWYFRNVPDGDEERLERVDLHHLGVIPQGLTWVLPNERHQVNDALVSAAFSRNRQLMSEAASSFVQDSNDGTQKELTATEVMARVNQASALLGSMLTRGYVYQTSEYREIARRFCELDNDDCKQFRMKCQSEGVDPSVFKDLDAWEITPVKVMGSGNKMLQVAQAQQLMGAYDRFDPNGKRIVLRLFAEANTDDSQLSDQIAPLNMPEPSTAVEKATMSWGTLMDGKQVILTRGFNVIEYIQTLLTMLAQDVALYNQSGQTPSPEKVQGYATVIANLKLYIAQLAQDPGEKQRVKEFNDVLGQIENFVKAFYQRNQEAAQAQAQDGNSEVNATIQAKIIAAQTDAKIAEAKAAQKLEHNQQKFVADQGRKNAAVLHEAERGGARVAAENTALAARTSAQIASEGEKTAAQIRAEGEDTLTQ